MGTGPPEDRGEAVASEYLDSVGVGGQTFNSDLLVSEADVAAAKGTYPTVWPLLVNRTLLGEFMRADEVANAAKRSSTWVGLSAIGIGLVGLATAAFARLIEGLEPRTATALTILGIVFGVLGPVMGVKASGNTGPGSRWLRARFATERLRQFHFQSLLVMLRVSASYREASTDCLAERISVRLTELTQRFRTGFDAEFLNFIDPVTGPRAYRFFRAQDAVPVDTTVTPLQQELLDAYRELRIERQRSYCQHVLRHPRGFFDFPVSKQRDWLTILGPACVLLMLVLHLAHGVTIARGAHLGAYLDAGVLFFALVALAGRALESGLSPDEEVERYETYQRRCLAAGEAFDGAATLHQKLEAMDEMEVAAAEELHEFLRVKTRSRFVM